jgi:hypothetical protein
LEAGWGRRRSGLGSDGAGVHGPAIVIRHVSQQKPMCCSPGIMPTGNLAETRGGDDHVCLHSLFHSRRAEVGQLERKWSLSISVDRGCQTFGDGYDPSPVHGSCGPHRCCFAALSKLLREAPRRESSMLICNLELTLERPTLVKHAKRKPLL